MNYEFIEVEGEGETGPLIEEYINETHPDLDLLVVGTRNLGGLKRYNAKVILGVVPGLTRNFSDGPSAASRTIAYIMCTVQ